MWHTLITVLHVSVAVGIVGLVLLQHGKGADAGAAFGAGASATVFGARGSASFLTRATAILACIFFVTSLSLGFFSGSKRVASSVTDQSAQPAPAAAAPVDSSDKPPSPDAPPQATIPPEAAPAASPAKSSGEQGAAAPGASTVPAGAGASDPAAKTPEMGSASPPSATSGESAAPAPASATGGAAPPVGMSTDAKPAEVPPATESAPSAPAAQ